MITINPENPSSDDPLVFEFVVFSNGCCEFTKTSGSPNFQFEMVPIEPAPPIVGGHPVEIDYLVGRLKVGEYQVTLVDNYRDPITLEFSVSQGELPFPASPIPSLGFAGAILLAVALAWIANKALKRMPRSTA